MRKDHTAELSHTLKERYLMAYPFLNAGVKFVKNWLTNQSSYSQSVLLIIPVDEKRLMNIVA
jgi:hypothetical protein